MFPNLFAFIRILKYIPTKDNFSNRPDSRWCLDNTMKLVQVLDSKSKTSYWSSWHSKLFRNKTTEKLFLHSLKRCMQHAVDSRDTNQWPPGEIRRGILDAPQISDQFWRLRIGLLLSAGLILRSLYESTSSRANPTDQCRVCENVTLRHSFPSALV